MSARTSHAAAMLLVGAALVAACRTQPEPRFPHLEHLAGIPCGGDGQPACPTCSSCHEGTTDTARALEPDASDCSTCHDRGQQLLTQSLQRSHATAPRRAEIEFPHVPHLALPEVKGQCVTCHAGVVDEAKPRERMPDMAKCLDCHQADFDQAKCSPCHVAADLPRLVPQTFLRHTDQWIGRHGVAARGQQQICEQCHTESQCADCHDQRQNLPIEVREPDAISSEQVHRGNFIARHAIEARSNSPSCLKCHTAASCDACHVERGVSAARAGSVSPHPIGWVGRDTGAKDFHGRAARRNIASCAACHDHGPATNCIQCHRVGAHGGSPHPRGWGSSRSQSSAICRYCHEN